ncbi:hypothetical protein LTR27_007232 [Elasticomyces elasticus]|nr:hypothetical protein LTR27_007232 [Elasticomyces elasticus]
MEQSLQIRRSLFVTASGGVPLVIDVVQTKLEDSPVVLTRQSLEPLPLFRRIYPNMKLVWDDVKDKRVLNTIHTTEDSEELVYYYFYWPLKSVLAFDSQFWRSMLLIQPVCTALSIELWGENEAGHQSRFSSADLRVPEGIRLGVIADSAKAMVKDEEVHEEIVVRLGFRTRKPPVV